MTTYKLTLLATVIATLVTFQSALADKPVALIVKVEGQVTTNGTQTENLSYLNSKDVVKLGDSSQLAFSYVEGGLRVKVNGPCNIRIEPGGPVLLEGKPESLNVTRPARRVGSVLPKDQIPAIPGSLRRNILQLHLAGNVLPGPQTLGFSGLPGRQFYFLTVKDTSDRKIFEAEARKGEEFQIPDKVLKPGGSYRFLLQVEGDSQELTQSVSVLSQEEASKVQGLTALDPNAPQYVFEASERLATYLHYRLYRESLPLVEALLAVEPGDPKLSTLRSELKESLGY